MNILAINDGHNASACLLQDGVLNHAVQEERFTLMKNQGGFPRHSVDWIMRDAALDVDSLDFVVLGSWRNPGTSYTRAEIVQSYIRQAQSPSIWKFQLGMWRQGLLKKIGLYEKVKTKYDKARLKGLTQNLPDLPHKKIAVLDHHLCHASSAFYGGPWAKEEALVLTLDVSGDGRCATVYVGSEGKLHLVAATPVGHSLGDIYSYTTHLMGFVPLEHEYKLMGMAPYVDQDRAEDVSNIFESYLGVDGLVFKRRIREPTFFIGRRLREDLKYVRFDLIAAGLQLFTEKTILQWVKNAINDTKIRKLCLAGGTFMNVKANGLIAQLDEVENIFICPSCGDESLSIGAAYEWYAQVHNYKKMGEPLTELYLGPDIDESELVLLVSKNSDLRWEKPGNVPLRVAELLAQGEIVARCKGRTEFGSRALGNRSIFADPSNPFVVHTLNKMIKM